MTRKIKQKSCYIKFNVLFLCCGTLKLDEIAHVKASTWTAWSIEKEKYIFVLFNRNTMFIASFFLNLVFTPCLNSSFLTLIFIALYIICVLHFLGVGISGCDFIWFCTKSFARHYLRFLYVLEKHCPLLIV